MKNTNISSQLPICSQQGTKNLSQVTNIFKNTRIDFFFKYILLGGIIKVFKLTNKSI